MTEQIILPLESVEDGPVRDCLEILRQWTEDLAKEELIEAEAEAAAEETLNDPLSLLGVKAFETSGSTAQYAQSSITSPGTEIVGVIGVFNNLNSGTWVPLTLYNSEFGIGFHPSGASVNTLVVYNTKSTTMPWKATIFYK